MPDISYIVSAYDRPLGLQLVLLSLLMQTHENFEIIVTDNDNDARANGNERVVNSLSDRRISYVRAFCKTCYHSAEYGATLAKGRYLCFPSDDSYYMPVFGEAMLSKPAPLVLCNAVYDRRLTGKYEVLDTAPVVGRVDKTTFLLQKHFFPGFPNKPTGNVPANCDGMLIESLVAASTPYHKIDEVLVVHN